MPKSLSTALVALAIVATSPGVARAFKLTLLETSVIYGVAETGAAGMNLAFTIDDIRMAARGRTPTRNDGIHEVAWNAAALAMEAGFLATWGDPTGHEINFAVTFPSAISALWSMVLMGHGIWAIAKGSTEQAAPAAARPKLPALVVVPGAIGDAAAHASGLSLVGRF